MEAILLLIVLLFFRFVPASFSERSAVLAMAQEMLWSVTFLALVDRLLNFGVEVIRLST